MLNNCAHVDRIEKLEAQNQKLSDQLEENTRQTIETNEKTSEIYGVLQSWSGAMKTLETIGRVFKPLGYIAIFIGACAGAWTSIKSGILPK